MSAHTIHFSSGYSYQKSGKIKANTRTVWFLLHGYGQLAKDFLKHFHLLLTDETCLIAPQALSLFYLKGFTGKVGASWLTYEEREYGIDNYIAYLNAIYKKEVKPFEDRVLVNLLGFSQGAATVSRWAIRSGIPFNSMVLWGGFLANEIGKELASKHLKSKKVYLVYGNRDHLVTPNVQRNIKRKCKVLDVDPILVTYEGGHEIVAGPLQTIMGED